MGLFCWGFLVAFFKRITKFNFNENKKLYLINKLENDNNFHHVVDDVLAFELKLTIHSTVSDTVK